MKLNTVVVLTRGCIFCNVALYPGAPTLVKYERYVMAESSSNSELARSSGRNTRGIPKCCLASFMASRQLFTLKSTCNNKE